MITAQFVVKYQTQQLQRQVERAKRSATTKQLAFIRRRARTDVLRRRKTTSAPNNPPHVKAPSGAVATLRNIRFSYEGDGAGVVGPVKLNQVNAMVGGGTQPVPSILEHGGTVRLFETRYMVRRGGFTPWRRRDLRRSVRPNQQLRVRRVTIAKRPFMSEALSREIESGSIMDPWARAVNNGNEIRLGG